MKAAILEELDSDPQVRVVILTGNSKVFAAGADIKEMISKNFVDMFYNNFCIFSNLALYRYLRCS